MPASNRSSQSPLSPASSPVPAHDGLPLEPPNGRGRRHGTSGSEPFDRWFRYPAGFASDYVSTLLEHLDLAPGSLIVDPFAGSGVTGTAARRTGLSFYGIEAHPLIAELGKLKLAKPPIQTNRLIDHSNRIIANATARLEKRNRVNLSREPELVRRCFTDPVLTRLVILRELISFDTNATSSGYLKWALLATLRDVATSRVGWPYQRPGTTRKPQHTDVFARFHQRVKWMVEDLSTIQEDVENEFFGQVISGDARNNNSWAGLQPGSARGCVSSPPYLNNFDYADATRLELYFLGSVTSWSQMCATVRADMITATTQQTSVGSAKMAAAELQRLGRVGAKIEELTERLRLERVSRARGKEYDRVLPAYFAAIQQILANLAHALSPGAPAVLLIGDSAPYGVYVDTPGLIAEIGQFVGFAAEKDVVLRRRGLRWAANSQRHRTELAERLVVLRRL